MKAGIFVAAALVQIAAAQPHRHLHQHAHEKRQVYVTDVSYATVTAGGPDVVVYVDAAGNPVTTSTVGGSAPTEAPVAKVSSVAPPPAETSAPAAVFSAPTVDAQVVTSAAPTSEAPAPTSTTAAPPAATTKAHKSSSSSSASSGSGSSSVASGSGLSGTGIVYNAYNADGTCKTQSQVDTDFAQLGPKGYGLVRIYGTDCDQVATVGSAVKQYGMKLFAGLYDLNSIQDECDTIIAASNGDFSYIDTISVGNELVNSGQASAGQVVAALQQARGIMTAAGYTGSMVTVDTFNAVIANPTLCENSDYAAVNAHPFFDSTILPEAAGVWAVGTMALVKAACGGKHTVITETGMPWGGTCNGLMCPSPANQAAAISSLESSFPDGGIIILSAYNDLWKSSEASTFFAEQSWGIYGDAPTS